MNMHAANRPVRDRLAAWWGWVLVASSAVILSACSAPNASISGWANPSASKTVASLQPKSARGAIVANDDALRDPATGERIISIQAQSPDSSFYATQPMAAAGYAPPQAMGPPPGYALNPNAPQVAPPAPPYPGMAPGMYGPPPGYGQPPCGPNGCPYPGAGYGPPPGYAPTAGYGPAPAAPFNVPVVIDPSVRYCPPDEYICDGGDNKLEVRVGKDWSIYGLDQEDTVAHYDTLDGETRVEKSNKVCIYSPRFAAVRSVTGLNLNGQVVNAAGTDKTQKLNTSEERVPVIARVQNLQLGRNISTDRAGGIINRQGLGMSAKTVNVFQDTAEFKLHEDFSLIRFGVKDVSEGPQLANAALAAIRWTSNQGVSVAIDGERAAEVVFDAKVQEVVKVHAVGKSKLQIVKTASKAAANVGEEIDFTLRFDNVGDRPIGNVVIVDNLTTRLEYVEGSVQSSCKLDYARDESGEIQRTENGHPVWSQNPIRFYTQLNEGETLVLRWELQEPLMAGQGGIIRFKCRVR